MSIVNVHHHNWEKWGGQPFFPISAHYKQVFGQKVQKIPVSVASTCPNREGFRGMETCVFCDIHGSFAYPESQTIELSQQLSKHKEKVAKRFRAKKFLVYFQAYTTSFQVFSKLQAEIQIALSDPDVVGIVLGTRPDCLSQRLIDELSALSMRTYVAIELGVQSFDDRQLEWMKRGHSAEASCRAVQRLRIHSAIRVGIHLIFGWPGETDHQIRQAARICNELGLDDVKLHNLHVLKGTELEGRFLNGEFKPQSFEEYCEFVQIFLEELSPEIAIHRLAALSAQWHELVAPPWTRFKMRTFQGIVSFLKVRGSFQGKKYLDPKAS